MSPYNNWDNYFEKAYISYNSIRDSNVSPDDRRQAIERFVESTDEFKQGGISARQKIADELESSNVYRQNVALRIALESYTSSTLEDISIKILSGHSKGFYRSNLVQLWGTIQPLHTNIIQYVKDDKPLRFPLIQGILNRYSKVSEKLALELLETDDDAIKEIVIRSIASWSNAQILWSLIDRFPHVDEIEWWATDHRSEIAFQLALQGQQDAIQILETALSHENQLMSVHASIRLSCLGIPSTIKELKALTKSKTVNIVELSLNAISALKSGSFINELALIAESDMTSEMTGVPLSDEAIRVLRYIFGDSGNAEQYTEGLSQISYTKEYCLEEVEYYQSISKQLDSSKRYYLGDLLTLQHLSKELLSPHDGQRFTALSNLRAISGQSFGFDLRKDIIANYSAIKAWDEYISEANFYVAGEWFYFGKPLLDSDT